MSEIVQDPQEVDHASATSGVAVKSVMEDVAHQLQRAYSGRHHNMFSWLLLLWSRKNSTRSRDVVQHTSTEKVYGLGLLAEPPQKTQIPDKGILELLKRTIRGHVFFGVVWGPPNPKP